MGLRSMGLWLLNFKIQKGRFVPIMQIYCMTLGKGVWSFDSAANCIVYVKGGALLWNLGR